MKILFKLALIAIVVVAVVFVITGGGCTDSNGTIKTLEAQGYTNIEITGWRPFQKSEDDLYATGFRADTPTGANITGTVTRGMFKGSTIRLD